MKATLEATIRSLFYIQMNSRQFNIVNKFGDECRTVEMFDSTLNQRFNFV